MDAKKIAKKVESGAMTLRAGAVALGMKYTTLTSRIYRGKPMGRACGDPVRPKSKGCKVKGNAAWQALAEE